MSDFDIIIGVDWLSFFRVKIDCFAKKITFYIPGQNRVIVSLPRGIAIVEYFLAHIDCEKLELTLASNPAVPKF